MTADQIREIIFFAQISKTPIDRALKRLTDTGYLVRLGRMVGGFGGGSEQYVYQLGRVGWRYLGKGGGYRPLQVIDHHTLTIGECFVILKRLERSGELVVIRYDADPVSRQTVGDILLTPDAYVEIGVAAGRQKFVFWLEIDRDTENAEIIRGKCVRYFGELAWEHACKAIPAATEAELSDAVEDLLTRAGQGPRRRSRGSIGEGTEGRRPHPGRRPVRPGRAGTGRRA